MPKDTKRYPKAARVVVVFPGGKFMKQYHDCEVRIRYDERVVNLFRDGNALVTAPLELCIVFWQDDQVASGAATAPEPPRDTSLSTEMQREVV